MADDEACVRRLLARLITAALPGARVVQTGRAGQVLPVAADLRPRLVVLDWVFAGGSTGPAICRQLKTHPRTRDIPVLLISGLRTGLRYRCRAVNEGADLFLRKPFSPMEFTAYVRALWARARTSRDASVLRVGSLSLRPEDRAAWWGDRRLPALTPRLYDLLLLLARRSPAPVPVSEIVRRVWGDAVRDQHPKLVVSRLRRRLRGLDRLTLEAVPGAGYRLRVG